MGDCELVDRVVIPLNVVLNVMRSSKRCTKSENWFSQMQLKLVEEGVRNIKKKIKSIDALEVEL